MDGSLLAALAIGTMLGFIAVGVPVGIAMGTVGIVGLTLFGDIDQAALQLTAIAFEKGTDFVFITAPLFILMGQLVYRSGFAEELYDCVEKWLGWLPGGLAITSVVACAGFAAITGVSAATVVTMGAMAVPAMQRHGYDPKLATGSLAIAGTLGILIPPSILMVLYGIWTETSIGALFLAGVVPGVLLTAGFAALILVRCMLRPELGPTGPRYPLAVRLRALRQLLPILLVFGVVIGGIYGGVFTPTEAAGFGAVSVFLIALAMRRLNWAAMKLALEATTVTSAMIFMIILGGSILARYVALTEIAQTIVDGVRQIADTPYAVIALLTVMYLILGAIMDVFGMLILTLPFVFPLILSVGIDPIWFGVYVTIIAEIALVTPPIGVNTYVMHSVARDVPLGDIFRGVMPFVMVAVGLLVLLTVYPSLVLWLPSLSGR